MGVLKLTLSDGGYTWKFIPVQGKTLTDAGSGTCHGAPGAPGNHPPTAGPGGPYSSAEATAVTFDGSTSSDPDGDALTYAWDFGDGTTGSGVKPTHIYADNGAYSVTLTVSDTHSASSAPGTTTATIANTPPTVNAGGSQTANAGSPFTLSATFSDPGVKDSPWSYAIDWGDGSPPTSGSTTSQSNPLAATHTYEAGGTYTVALKAADNQGATGTASKSVTVAAANQPPTAAFTASCTGLTCSFTSTSSDPDGSISAYSWTFGDGATATSQNPAHTYAAGGTYTITVTVTDNQGATGSTSKTVTVAPPNQPPTAAFTASCSALTCSFTSTSSDPDGSISAYSWTFGDGATATSQNPAHTYSAGGTYRVTLKVTDNQGATGTTSKTVAVTAPNQPPSAAFTASCSALTCNFASTSSDPDGSIAAYSWTLGDGTTSTAQNPSHTYAAGGTYTVTLKVTDNQGATGSTSHSVTVSQPNQPPTVNAGSDATVLLGLLYTEQATFSDPDNDGPWSYTISWGDGTSTSGSTSSQSTVSATHTYLLPGSYTIRETVVDSRGASGSDQKVLTVVL